MAPIKERIQDACTLFFYWWCNQPGTNTKQGFERWWKEGGKEFRNVLRRDMYEEIINELEMRDDFYVEDDDDGYYSSGYADGIAHTISLIRTLKDNLGE